MAVALERDFQLGIDRVSELINDAYGSMVNHTPKESDGASVNPPDIEAIVREVANLPGQLRQALNVQYLLYRQLSAQRRILDVSAPYCEQDGYGAKFILYGENSIHGGWYNPAKYNTTGFSVTLESPRERINISTVDYPDETRGVEVLSRAQGEDTDKVSMVIKREGIAKIKWFRQVDGFKNTREVSFTA